MHTLIFVERKLLELSKTTYSGNMRKKIISTPALSRRFIDFVVALRKTRGKFSPSFIGNIDKQARTAIASIGNADILLLGDRLTAVYLNGLNVIKVRNRPFKWNYSVGYILNQRAQMQLEFNPYKNNALEDRVLTLISTIEASKIVNLNPIHNYYALIQGEIPTTWNQDFIKAITDNFVLNDGFVY